MSRFLLLALPASLAFGFACSSDDEPSSPPPPASTTSSGGMAATGGAATTSGGGDGGGGAQGGQGGQGGDGGSGGSCTNSLPVEMTPPPLLSQTGLYDDITTKAVRSTSRLYAPQYPLWSDGVDKNRWMYVPECGVIDNGDDDFWDFPVGTRAWKEFTTDGKRLETRLIMRTGPGASDFVFATYQWRDDELEADLLTDGATDVRETAHDIPPDTSCAQCHGGHPFGGTPSRFLGFGAIQLSHQGAGATMQSLSDEGLLTVPRPQGYQLPGDATAQAALGMLHANCGNCHNESPDGLLFPQLNLLVSVTETTVEGTALYQQSVNVVPDNYAGQGCTHRIAGGSTAGSCIYERMSLSTMPPLASDVVHADGLAALEAWILTLPPPP